MSTGESREGSGGKRYQIEYAVLARGLQWAREDRCQRVIVERLKQRRMHIYTQEGHYQDPLARSIAFLLLSTLDIITISRRSRSFLCNAGAMRPSIQPLMDVRFSY